MTQTCDLASKGQDVLPREECHAPAEFAPHLLLGENAAQAADIHALVSDCSKQSNSKDYTTSLDLPRPSDGHRGRLIRHQQGGGGLPRH